MVTSAVCLSRGAGLEGGVGAVTWVSGAEEVVVVVVFSLGAAEGEGCGSES